MGAKRLAQLLVAERMLPQAQVVAAVRRQALIGGSLDTNLLEMQLVPETALLGAMERAFGAPSVGKTQLDAIGPHLARLFPWGFVLEYDLVPMRLDDQTLTVVGSSLPDPARVQHIREHYALEVVLRVTVEARLRYAMQRLYHVAPEPRFAQLLTLLDGMDSMVNAALDLFDLDVPPPSAAAPVQPPPLASTPPVRRSLEQALEQLEADPHRDRAIGVVIDFALTMFDDVGVFILHGARPHGWRSHPEGEMQRMDIDAQLVQDSIVRTIIETQSPYLGPLPRHDANERFISHIRRPWPKVACLTPINVGGRMAALLYADNGDKPVPPQKVADLMTLLQRCGMLWERLIRDRKRDAGAALSPTVLPGAGAQAGEASVARVPTPGEVATTAVAATADATAVVSAPPVVAAPAVVPQAAKPPRAGPAHAIASVAIASPSVVSATEVVDAVLAATSLATATPTPAIVDAPSAHAVPGSTGAPQYVMFSDVADSPRESLGDWQDVFVEVSQHDDGTASPRGPRPTARWSDVISLARAASRFVPIINQAPRADAAHIEHLLGNLDSPVGTTRQSAMAQLLNLGSLADIACQQAFPGRLTCDILARDALLPPFGRCSGLCHLLVSRGQEATAVVLPHLASDDPAKRLMAVYFFQAVHDSAGCPGLTLCLYDTERRVRTLAIETLRHYKNDLSYAYTVQVLRQQLQEPGAQQFAIQTLGQLREIFAVPSLIPLVAAPDTEIARAAASALAVICGQGFGSDVDSWQSWWRNHHYQPRPVWLLDGLQHANPTIRRVAHHELQHITGQVLDFDPQASLREREQRAQVWQHWLQTHDLDAHWHPTTART